MYGYCPREQIGLSVHRTFAVLFFHPRAISLVNVLRVRAKQLSVYRRSPFYSYNKHVIICERAWAMRQRLYIEINNSKWYTFNVHACSLSALGSSDVVLEIAVSPRGSLEFSPRSRNKKSRLHHCLDRSLLLFRIIYVTAFKEGRSINMEPAVQN